jgi:hypothetical protein
VPALIKALEVLCVLIKFCIFEVCESEFSIWLLVAATTMAPFASIYPTGKELGSIPCLSLVVYYCPGKVPRGKGRRSS